MIHEFRLKNVDEKSKKKQNKKKTPLSKQTKMTWRVRRTRKFMSL